jgi:ubiquinone/menaquinone biosynthesis C-methylase UbiE
MATVDYDAVSTDYDQRYDRDGYAGVADALATFVGDGDGGVLEVGCGTGHWLAWLTGHGIGGLAGIDASAGMLAKASAKVDDADLRHGRAEDLPWPDASFARVFAINALHHFDDQRRAIREMRRVSSSGGAMLTIGLDPHTGLDTWAIYDHFAGARETDLRRYSPTARIRRWMADAGFRRSETFVAMHRPGSIDARRAQAEGRLHRHATSQLTLLSDDAYEAGIARITDRIASAEARGGTLLLRSDLRVHATIGWV